MAEGQVFVTRRANGVRDAVFCGPPGMADAVHKSKRPGLAGPFL
jgi:NAD(P)H-flavin reductase